MHAGSNKSQHVHLFTGAVKCCTSVWPCTCMGAGWHLCTCIANIYWDAKWNIVRYIDFHLIHCPWSDTALHRATVVAIRTTQSFAVAIKITQSLWNNSKPHIALDHQWARVWNTHGLSIVHKCTMLQVWANCNCAIWAQVKTMSVYSQVGDYTHSLLPIITECCLCVPCRSPPSPPPTFDPGFKRGSSGPLISILYMAFIIDMCMLPSKYTNDFKLHYNALKPASSIYHHPSTANLMRDVGHDVMWACFWYRWEDNLCTPLGLPKEL